MAFHRRVSNAAIPADENLRLPVGRLGEEVGEFDPTVAAEKCHMLMHGKLGLAGEARLSGWKIQYGAG